MVFTRRHGPAAVGELDRLVADAAAVVVPFDAEQAAIGRQAFDRFGKGRHPARLNFGDCAAYALAKSRSLPLLFKGSHFSLTDIEPAVR
jgi:ribonuclease VapC